MSTDAKTVKTSAPKAMRDGFGRKAPLHANYCDAVSDEHLDSIKDAANVPDLSKAKILSGPAW